MTNEEIRQRVDECYNKIEESFDPTNFVFNPKVAELNLEISKLQAICKHNYNEGKCIYCDYKTK